KDIEAQVQGGVENGMGSAEYTIEELSLDRSQKAINTFYPEVAARKLKRMYERNHPLKGLDTASFGRQTELMKNPICPKK
ncbi:MAG: hypothetical protein LLG97_16070, partial [Deltaproteobacteria bacterium]|nr:hypothetical protein [Deltaproteobacteria bacterium]